MSLIPISRIFRNVLWLVEQEENVAKDDCLGVWDLNKKTQIPAQISYIDLVQGLGFDYFDCSLYENIKGEVNLSNMIDGKLRFTSPDVLFSKKSDDSMSDTVSEIINFEIKKQIPKLIQTNSHDFEVINDSDISTKLTEVSKEREASGDINPVDWLAKAAKITKEDIEQAQKNNTTNVADNIFTVHLTANTKRLAKAHHLLSNLLSNELESFGVPKAVKLTTDLFDEPSLKPSFELIPINLWKEKKAVPHYDHNALNLGEADQAYIELNTPNSHHLSKNDRPKDHRFWITNIVIDEEPFQQWYIPQASKYFKTPTKASMTFEKKHVIINFGEDNNVKVKLLEGFQVIRVLIEQAQMSRNNNAGIAPELLQSISKKLIKGISAEDLHNTLPEKLDELDNRGYLIDSDETEQFDIYETNLSTDEITIGATQEQSDSKVRTQKAKSRLRREINKYFKIQSSKKGPRKRQREVIELANKSLILCDPKNYKDNPTLTELLLMRKGAKRDGVLDNFLPHTHEDDDASGNTDRKKIQNSLWKTMKDALESIKFICPHFYFHMRETGAKSAKGAMRLHKGVNLIYKPDLEQGITWDFK